MNNNVALKMAIRLLNVAGQSFKVKENPFLKLISLISFVLVATTFILAILEPIKNFKSDKLPDYLDILTNYNLFLVYLIVFRLKRQIFIDLLNPIDFWPINHVGEGTAKKQRKYYGLVEKCFKLVLWSGFGAIIATFLEPIVRQERHLPMLFYHFVDFMETPFFQIGYLWILLNTMFVFSQIVGMDAIFYSLLCFVYCQVLMLKEALKNVDMDYDNEEDEKKCFELLKNYVEYHSKLLKYLKNLNEAFSSCLLSKFMTTILNCSMPVYFVANSGELDLATVTRAVFLIIVSLWNMFIVCAAVTIIMDQMESLGYSIYECKWANRISPRLRAVMIIVIQRSQRREVLLAGGVINVNLESFTSIINIAFSSYTLLISVMD